jgi:hypothetical protein
MFITIDPFFASDVFKMTLIPNSSNIDTCRFVTKNGAGDGGVGGNTQIKFESASNPNTNLPELKIYVPTYFTRTNNIPDDTPLVITLQNLAEKINVDVDDFQNNQNLLNLQISPYIVASNVELFSSYLIRSYDENFTQSPYANIYIDIPRNYLDQILLTVLSGNFKQITLNVKTDNAGNAIGLLYSLIIPPTLSYFNPMFTVNNPNFQNITYTCDSNLQPNGIINFLSYVPPSPAPDPSPPVPMENIAPIIGLILGGIIVVGILLFVISARIKKNKIMREESEDSDNEKKVKTLKGNE